MSRAAYLREWRRARRRLWAYHEGKIDLCCGELAGAIEEVRALYDAGNDPTCRAAWQNRAAASYRHAVNAAYRARYWGERAPGSATVALAVRQRAQDIADAREALSPDRARL